MARKDLLKGLMGEDAPDKTLKGDAEPSSSAPKSPGPRYAKGAIGAVSQSIADLKSRALVEIVADQIDFGGVQDRLDDDAEAHNTLVASIREYGQQVPVLVRHDPNTEGRYQIVFGRRRVAALKELGMPVKAMVRDLTDRDLVVAQGQENTARKDLTFIEKVNFARQMREAGYDRKVIIDALTIDKTVISRMMGIADTVPPRVIKAIGAAPTVGRDRWMALAERISKTGATEAQLLAHAHTSQAKDSDARFAAVMKALQPERPAPPPPEALTSKDGATLGHVKRGKQGVTITLEQGDGFDEWLADNISEIHRSWKDSGG